MSKQSYENRDNSFEHAPLWKYRLRRNLTCVDCQEKFTAVIGGRRCPKCRGKRMRGRPWVRQR